MRSDSHTQTEKPGKVELTHICDLSQIIKSQTEIAVCGDVLKNPPQSHLGDAALCQRRDRCVSTVFLVSMRFLDAGGIQKPTFIPAANYSHTLSHLLKVVAPQLRVDEVQWRGRKPLCIAPSEASHGRLTAIGAHPSLALLRNIFLVEYL